MPDPSTTFWLSLFGMITLISVAGMLCKAWTSAHRLRLETASKRDMIQRGLSPDDIVRILTASGGGEDSPKPANLGGMDSASLQEVVSLLAENQASPAVIEEVLASLGSVDAATQQLVSVAVQSFYSSAEATVEGEHVLAIVRPLCQRKEALVERVVSSRDDRITKEAR